MSSLLKVVFQILCPIGTFLLWMSLPGWSQSKPQRLVNLKRTTTAHFDVFFAAPFRDQALWLSEDSEAFIEDLATRWAVILPESKIRITIGRGDFSEKLQPHLEHPAWLETAYDKSHKRVEVHISDLKQFEPGLARQALRHSLVHALLDLDTVQAMPRFLEEGLARYYSGHGPGRERFLSILGFQRFKSLESMLADDHWADSDSDLIYGGALGGLFVDWLWARRPDGEHRFVQALFKGDPWQEAVRAAGFKETTNLTLDFDFYVRPEYKLYTMVFTRDFWGILLGLLWLSWLGYRIFVAARVARTGFVEIQTTAFQDLDASDFKGPAFGQKPEAEAIPMPPVRPLPPKSPPAPKRDIRPPVVAETRVVPREKPKPPVAPKKVLPPTPAPDDSGFDEDFDIAGALDDLDTDLDAAFEQLEDEHAPLEKQTVATKKRPKRMPPRLPPK